MKYKKKLINNTTSYSGTATDASNRFFYQLTFVLLIPILLFFFYLSFFFKLIFCTLLAAFLSLTVFPVIYSLLLLIFTYVLASICFFVIGLDFLALCLIFIYVGAIAVLFVFVTMTLTPEKVVETRQIHLFEKLCFLIFVFTLALLFVLVSHYDFAKDLLHHWFQIYRETGLFVSDRGHAEPLIDIGLTLYGQQSYLFLLVVLLLFLGFLCPILLTLDEDANNRIPTIKMLQFPLSGEYIYFIYFYGLTLFFIIYISVTNAQADILNNVEYYLLLKLFLTQIKDAPEEHLTEYGTSSFLDTTIIGPVYSKIANDGYIVDILKFLPRGSMTKRVWAQTIHDIWQEYIRHRVSTELTSVIDSIDAYRDRLNAEYTSIQKLVEHNQLSSEAELLLHMHYLQKKTFFDLASLYLVFYISILLEPSESHSYLYIRSCIRSYEANTSEILYPLDYDGLLRREALEDIFTIVNTYFGTGVRLLNVYAKWPLWSTDFVSGSNLSTFSSRLLIENPRASYMSAIKLAFGSQTYLNLVLPEDKYPVLDEPFVQWAYTNHLYPRKIRIDEQLCLPILTTLLCRQNTKIIDCFTGVANNFRIFWYQNYVLLSSILVVVSSLFLNYIFQIN